MLPIRTLSDLQNQSISQWTEDELMYHKQTMESLEDIVTPTGASLLRVIDAEVMHRGKEPHDTWSFHSPSSSLIN